MNRRPSGYEPLELPLLYPARFGLVLESRLLLAFITHAVEQHYSEEGAYGHHPTDHGVVYSSSMSIIFTTRTKISVDKKRNRNLSRLVLYRLS